MDWYALNGLTMISYPATVTPFALEETVTTLYDWFMASQLNVQRIFFCFVANFVN